VKNNVSNPVLLQTVEKSTTGLDSSTFFPYLFESIVNTMNNPEYCQGVMPLYVLAGTTVAVSMFYVRMAMKESPKSFSATYGFGAVLFLVLGVSILIRALNVKTRNHVQVDDIYNDVFAHSKDMTKSEKTRLSALFSQAKYGDAPVSLYSYVASLSQAIAGFGYGTPNDPNSHSSNWKQWSEMRGIPQTNATNQLIDYTCSVFSRMRNTPAAPAT